MENKSEIKCRHCAQPIKPEGADEWVHDDGAFSCDADRAVFCVWCGKTIYTYNGPPPAEDEVPALLAAAQKHELECGKNPMREALEGMVAAFDGDGYGDKSIVETTRECALNIAIRTLGWERPNPTTQDSSLQPSPECTCRHYVHCDCVKSASPTATESSEEGK